MSTTFQITTVTNGTDTFTKVAHGLTTGQGPGCLRLGEGGVIPAGAAELTDYWPIVVDADNFKIASSLANAIANVPVNITSDGAGVIIFELGLPYRRQTTYAAGSQVKSADLDEIQDDLKALHALVTGQAQTKWPLGNLIGGTRVFNHDSLLFSATNWAGAGDVSVAARTLNSSGAGDADFNLNNVMFTGQRLDSVTVRCSGDGVVDLVATVYHHDLSLGTITPYSATLNNVPAGDNLLTITPIGVRLGQLHRLYLRVNANAANAVISQILLTTP